MFRVFMCVAACALPLVISSSAGAQSYVVLAGEPEISPPVPLGPPQSITQRYIPQSAAPVRELGLLVGDAAAALPPPPIAAISVTSPEPIVHTAATDLGIGHPVIVVLERERHYP